MSEEERKKERAKAWKDMITGFVLLIIAYIVYLPFRENRYVQESYPWFFEKLLWFFDNIPLFLGITFVVIIVLYVMEKLLISSKKEGKK